MTTANDVALVRNSDFGIAFARAWLLGELCILPGLLNTACGAECPWESVGIRGGPSISHANHIYSQEEIFSRWNLPWRFSLGHEWEARTRLDASVGCLGGRGENALVGTVGPEVALKLGKLPVHLEGGVSPTGITRHEFGNTDFGIGVQFTTHVGLEWKFAEHWQMGYRFQRMSNAGLAHPNPGLNLQMVSFAYAF